MSGRPHHQREQSWSDTSTSYERMFMPFSRWAALAALDAVGLREGERFLDIAAGTGALTVEARSRGAEVVAIDFAEGMLGVLRNKLAGDAGVETHVMDGQRLTLETGAFDVAGSNFGLIFFPDYQAGLRELHRVLRPGGRGFVTSMGRPATSPLMQRVLEAVGRGAPGWQPSAPPATIELSTSETMRAALAETGFESIETIDDALQWPVPDPGSFWDEWVLHAPPTAAMMASLTAEQQSAGRAAFVEAIEADAGDGAASYPTDIVIGVGVKGADRG